MNRASDLWGDARRFIMHVIGAPGEGRGGGGRPPHASTWPAGLPGMEAAASGVSVKKGNQVAYQHCLDL